MVRSCSVKQCSSWWLIPVNIEQARHVYEIVAVLQGPVLERAAPHLSVDDLECMADAKDLGGALEHGTMHAAVDADDVFHGVYLAHTNNAALVRLLRYLKRKTRRLEAACFHLEDSAHASV